MHKTRQGEKYSLKENRAVSQLILLKIQNVCLKIQNLGKYCNIKNPFFLKLKLKKLLQILLPWKKKQIKSIEKLNRPRTPPANRHFWKAGTCTGT